MTEDPCDRTPEQRYVVAHRWATQLLVFANVTVECSRCSEQVALAHLVPTTEGLHCKRCLVRMPSHEFERLTAVGGMLDRLGGT